MKKAAEGEAAGGIDLSIVIVNWNTAQVTCDCLESIYATASGFAFETILVDNASSDGSVAMVRERFPQVEVIANRENRGFAAANNQGMAIARGRYVLLLNNDTVVRGDALGATLRFADSRPEAGIIGCRLLNPDGSLQRSCFQCPSISNLLISAFYLNKLFPRSAVFGKERMTWWAQDQVREVEAVMGAFMFVRKAALDAVGGMDEDFFMYGEETDWCRRFAAAGWKVLYTPAAEVTHLGGQSSKKAKAKSLIRLRLGILQFLRKRYRGPAYVLAGLLVSAFFAIRLPVWLFLSALDRRDAGKRERLEAYAEGWRRVLIATFSPKLPNFRV